MGGRLRKIVISVVTLVWAANFLAPLFIKDYEPSPELNVAFSAMLGLLLAGGHHNTGGNNGGGNQPPPRIGTSQTRTDNHDTQGTEQNQ